MFTTSSGARAMIRPGGENQRKKCAGGAWLAFGSRSAVHELSIAMSLVDTICDELPKIGAARVRIVRVRVGALSGVAGDALTFAFDVAADGSPIAGARLEVEHTDGRELQLLNLEVLDDVAADR